MADESRGDPGGQLRARRALALLRARGMAEGRAAASADTPGFLSNPALIAAAWAASACSPAGHLLPAADRDEYFLAWVHGYVGRADELEE